MNDRMSLRNKIGFVTGIGWPMTANGAKRPFRRASVLTLAAVVARCFWRKADSSKVSSTVDRPVGEKSMRPSPTGSCDEPAESAIE